MTLNYKEMEGSMYNTPPCWSIYVCGLVFKHLLEAGGLPAVKANNDAKVRGFGLGPRVQGAGFRVFRVQGCRLFALGKTCSATTVAGQSASRRDWTHHKFRERFRHARTAFPSHGSDAAALIGHGRESQKSMVRAGKAGVRRHLRLRRLLC